jgi:hypothetical protein
MADSEWGGKDRCPSSQTREQQSICCNGTHTHHSPQRSDILWTQRCWEEVAQESLFETRVRSLGVRRQDDYISGALQWSDPASNMSYALPIAVLMVDACILTQ